MISLSIAAPRRPRPSVVHRERTAVLFGFGIGLALGASYAVDAARDMAQVEARRVEALNSVDRLLAILDERDPDREASVAVASSKDCETPR